MMILEGRLNCFIIEDNIFVRNTLFDILPLMGFEIVGMASTHRDAFRDVADTRPDVILLDISLPGITAEEVIRGLMAINRNAEIVILAPLTNQSEISKLMKLGARDFIPKPLVPRQVEYVLRTIELSAGIRPQTEIQSIAQIHSLFYNEMLKHAPENVYDEIHNAVHEPLKRLNKVYPDRYEIQFNPIKFTLKLATSTHTREIYIMYKVQLDRLYYSIARRLNKVFPLEFCHSLLGEVYQNFYPLARYLMDNTGYDLPEWEGYLPEFYDPNYVVSTVQYEYKPSYEIQLTEYPPEDVNKRLSAYKMVVTHDPRVAPKFPRPDRDGIRIDQLDIHILLSYFDDIMGPTAGTIIPPPHGRMERDMLTAVPRLMDMIGANPGEPFMHAANDFGSVNIIFTVKLRVRGGVRDYMISIVVTPPDIRVMVKIQQMNTVLKAVAAEMINFYRENPDLAESDMKLTNEPEKILSELLEEVQNHLRS